MLSGSIWDKMILFALPLAFTGVLQQLYNAADVAVLGHFVSDEAMAAVGNNVPIIGLIVSLCMGLALGANVVVAQALGMRDEERASRGVHTAFYVAVVFGVVMAIAGEIGADWIIACRCRPILNFTCGSTCWACPSLRSTTFWPLFIAVKGIRKRRFGRSALPRFSISPAISFLCWSATWALGAWPLPPFSPMHLPRGFFSGANAA
jgi:hypothetical protein